MNQEKALKEVEELIHSIGWSGRVNMNNVSYSSPRVKNLFVVGADVDLSDYILDLLVNYLKKIDHKKDDFGLSDADLGIERVLVELSKDLDAPLSIFIERGEGVKESLKDELFALGYLAWKNQGKLYLDYVQLDDVSGWVAGIVIKWDLEQE